MHQWVRPHGSYMNVGRFWFHKGGKCCSANKKKLSSIIWPAGAAKTGCKNTKNGSQYGNEGEVPTYKTLLKKNNFLV